MKPRPDKKRQHHLRHRPHSQPSNGRVTLRGNEVLIYGRHSARHALLNPKRVIREVYATPQTLALPHIAEAIKSAQTRHATANIKFTIHNLPAAEFAKALAKMTGDTTPHTPTSQGPASQGIVLVAQHLPSPSLAEWLDSKQNQAKKLRVVLGDQLQDARNIGGILRSLWAFGGDAFITTHRHAPSVTSALLKAASGAGEYVGVVGVGNLSQAIKVLQEAGFFVVGLDAPSASGSGASSSFGVGAPSASGGDASLSDLSGHGRLALVVGSEGKGLRQLTRKRVDQLVSIPMYNYEDDYGGDANNAESLNASVATAIALFVAMHGN